MPPTILRPYQKEAVAAVLSARRDGTRRMVVCLPTGSGKTVIFSELARMARRPVLVLAHRRELVDQAREKLAHALADPSVVAVEQGGEAAAASARVVVASIRSLHEERLARLLALRRFGLVIYDECHHAAAEDNKRVLASLGAFQADWGGTLLGFTATPSRADGQGLDTIFERVVYSRSLSQMIDGGFLVPLRGYRVATAADLEGVTAGSGDFAVEELAEAVDIQDRNALVARTIQELARDRRTIVFCVTVRHAANLARALAAVGVPAGVVHGTLPPEERARVLAAFRAGRISAITNVGVLTEGFDDPGVSCVAMARPTRSDGLYAQCVGRGTRLSPGKKDCLVLDFVDLSALSLVTLPTLAGLPRDLDLQGMDLRDAERAMQALWGANPGFEVEPGAITLGEIQDRAAAFDPLKLDIDPDLRAISANRWESLGSRGLALHVAWTARSLRSGTPSLVLVLDQGGRKGSRRWRVTLDGKEMARFSRLEEAVEAVDHEVGRRGRAAATSALPGAGWRAEPVDPDLRAQLAALRPPAVARTRGEALRLLVWAHHGPRR